MGHITSINRAAAASAGLRTTIPQSITTHFQLKEDRLDWEITVRDGEMLIFVKPLKALQGG